MAEGDCKLGQGYSSGSTASYKERKKTAALENNKQKRQQQNNKAFGIFFF